MRYSKDPTQLKRKTYDECKTVQDEHHKAMEVRAKENGMTLPAPRNNGCERMKVRGLFKQAASCGAK